MSFKLQLYTESHTLSKSVDDNEDARRAIPLSISVAPLNSLSNQQPGGHYDVNDAARSHSRLPVHLDHNDDDDYDDDGGGDEDGPSKSQGRHIHVLACQDSYS